MEFREIKTTKHTLLGVDPGQHTLREVTTSVTGTWIAWAEVMRLRTFVTGRKTAYVIFTVRINLGELKLTKPRKSES